jgi:GT2 family glycosyltransferase/glycosyltransferase involved in cell wall biosynthesis
MTQQKAEEVSRWALSLQQRPLQYWFKRRGLATARALLGVLPISTTTRFRLRNAYLRLRRRLNAQREPEALLSAQALPTNVQCAPDLPRLDLGVGHGPDLYVFGVIDWSFRIQRPQHLALELARRGHRVFYFSPAFRDAPSAGYQFERIDAALPVWQVHLQLAGVPSIYADAPDPQTLEVLRTGLARFMHGAQSAAAIAMVDHAFWAGLAESLPNTRLVYDCMDHHEGFGGVAPGLLALERQLIENADLVLTSSAWLEKEVGSQARANATVRNAGDFEHFAVAPDPAFRDPEGRPVIGYFGAIADWFDIELIERVADAHPECLILLIGNDTVGAAKRLATHPNVTALGERPYAELPFYLHGFDVCLMPFLVLPLTLATNPVKVYEYLAAGKPVVAVELPEMAQFGDRVRTAVGHDAFVAAVSEALAESRSGNPGREARIAFARENTWAERANAIETALAALVEPRVSVVILCYNNLALSKRCIDSILSVSDYPALEVVIVDNASTDGSADYLRELGREHPEIKLVLNDKNLGYAAGNNAGLEVATGDYIVLLNNDTEVTPGWVRTLLRHFRRDPQIGLLGPVTNNIGNEARIELDYPDSEGMRAAAARHTLSHMGRSRAMSTLAFFCVMLPRRVLDACGLLCEDYGLGWFEDDDYCRRVQSHGFRLALAEDVFIHHELSASFGKLPSKEKQALFERNKAIYESKWGQWQPHEYR